VSAAVSLRFRRNRPIGLAGFAAARLVGAAGALWLRQRIRETTLLGESSLRAERSNQGNVGRLRLLDPASAFDLLAMTVS
jgi:hypothetical protein